MDFSAIKTLIEQNIRTNNNEDITGSVLQNVLLGIIETLGDDAINDLITALGQEVNNRQNAVQGEADARSQADNTILGKIANILNGGYLYQGIAGVATNPGNPTVSCFYFAKGAGTYTNFRNGDNDPIVITDNGLYALTYEAVENEYWEYNKITDLDDGVFDISRYHASGGTLATYADLSAALGTNGANVPAAFRKGGMSVKFIHSSDNKYVQYRYMGTDVTTAATFTNVANWQGVDKEIVEGSKNIPESAAVKRITDAINARLTKQEDVLRTFVINSVFYIADSQGYVVAKVDSQGVHSIDYTDGQGNTFSKIRDKVSSISNKVDNLLSTYRNEYNDSFYIVDSSANVAFKISASGTDIAKFGENTKELIKNLVNYHDDPMYSREFLVVDGAGYIAFRIHSDGSAELNFQLADNSITTPKMQDKSVTPSKIACLSGYTLYSFGDSISLSGRWQNRVAEITGCAFDSAVNIDNQHPLSVGGMGSSGTGFYNLLWRVKNLIIQNEEKHLITDGGEKSIFVLQNANDAWSVREWVQSANTFIPGDVIDAGLASDFNATVLQNIPLASRTLNTVLKLSIIAQGTNVKIVNLPVREGNVQLSISLPNTGTINYNMHMVPQATEAATLAYCLERILEYKYVDVDDTLADDQVSVNFSKEGSGSVRPTITFTDTDNTGMSVLISDTDNAKASRAYYFIGSSVQDADWAVTSNWQIGLNFSEGLKSGIELLKRTFPKAHVFLTMFPVFNVTPSEYLTPKGTYDHEAFYESTQEVCNRALITAYNSAAAYYNIPMLNLHGESGIELDNVSTYFYDSNVHPKVIGYDKFGEVLSAQLARYFKN